MSGRWLRAAPFAVALFFACWALRGAFSGDVCLTDAARHAMNGAYVYDMVRQGELFDPIAFGRSYYSRLPALSLPYHPPLFPVIEALFFSVLGVNVLAARLAVAAAVGASVLLLYRLIVATHDSHAVAAAVALTFFTNSSSNYLATDVMLEFPALAFALGALYCLRGLGEEFPLRSGLSFALLAGAAVWTKQQTVFLGLVPFFYLALAGRWRWLAGRTLWVSSALFGALVLLVLLPAAQFNWAGYDQVSRGAPAGNIFLRNLRLYWEFLNGWFSAPVSALLVATFVAGLLAPGALSGARGEEGGGKDSPLALYVAWAAAALLVVLLLDAYESRYLLFAVPALLVIGYTALARLCRLARLPALARLAPLGLALLSFAFNIPVPPLSLRGPSEAAGLVLGAGPRRVIYCGRTNGSFIFAARSLDQSLRTVVVRCDKLPASRLTPDGLEDFAHRYGIEYVIVERTPWEVSEQSRRWGRLLDAPARSMEFEREVPLVSTDLDYEGALFVYRFTNPSPNPENVLTLPVAKVGGAVEMDFGPRD